MSEQRRTVIRGSNTINSNTDKTIKERLNTRAGSIQRIVERKMNTYTDAIKPGTRQLEIQELFNQKKSNTVYIIAGGPSLKGFNFMKLKEVDTIAINASAEFIQSPTYFVTMDYTFLRKGVTDVHSLSGNGTSTVFVVNMVGSVKHQDKNYIDVANKMKYDRLNEFNHVIESHSVVDNSLGFSNSLAGFSHGGNSGFCAIQLAIILGYEKIYLLGFDMNVDSGFHFHEKYKGNTVIKSKINQYKQSLKTALNLFKGQSQIINCSAVSSIKEDLPYVSIEEALPGSQQITIKDKINPGMNLENLLIVGYYTLNTPYEEEALGLINSCKKLNLNHEIIGVSNLGNWQSNTRYKATFMLDMLNKHPDKRLLYVDCDAVIHKLPNLFIDYSADIAVRYQDFNWRKNECLSGTIYMENNEKTKKLCRIWADKNVNEGPQASSLEQWNLGLVIEEMVQRDNLVCKNLPPEYTFIFDTMKRIYPGASPVIEHFQASRRHKSKI